MSAIHSSRLHFLKQLAALPLAALLPSMALSNLRSSNGLKPRRLRTGDTVGLINPAGPTWHPVDIEIVEEILAALDLKVKRGRHLLDRYGYLAGKDADRAADVNQMFADTSVDALLAVRGGWGCNRILPLLDYDLIRRNPKVIMGYSDITGLLLAIYARTGLVTFHGPVGISTWNDFSVDLFRRILFEGQTPTLRNPGKPEDELAQTENRVQTITPGQAQGIMVGGNLSVLTAMLGSPYLPDWKGKILFLEEVDEKIYRVDRMLTQLRLAGVLDEIAGLVFGKCTNCGPGDSYGSLTLEEVLNDHLLELKVPAWYGAMIGHITDKFTVPLGIQVRIDAGEGSIRMLEPAVT
ncbi:MAG: LD-carboxypeptidase [Fidelibacterota bacterium]|nr:MAG: LD-carboxypeptidase [Candidatus Neomarinimicrobiota bacterium]